MMNQLKRGNLIDFSFASNVDFNCLINKDSIIFCLNFD